MPSNSTIPAIVAEHPRLMGGLFTLCLLLSQAGTAVAGNGGSAY